MSIRKGSRTIASSVPVTEWGSVDGTLTDQADLKSALDSKAPTYSPTFTGTPIAPTAPIGVSNNQIATTKFVQDALLASEATLPEQEGNAGKFLTTNGSIPSWESITGLPSQESQSGKFLTTNGTSASWGNIDLSGKVDKISNVNIIYGTNYQGSQTGYGIASSSATAWSVAQRNADGVIVVGTPTSDDHAATKKYVDDNAVKKTGDETIAGIKTFTSWVKYNTESTNTAGYNAPAFWIKDNNLDTTTNPSYMKEYYVCARDNADRYMGWTTYRYNTDGSSQTLINARTRDTDNTEDISASISIKVNRDGTAVTSAPTPSSVTDNTTKIATTEWVIDVLEAIYPVGSLYMGTQNSCPLSAFFGTWTLVSAGNALWTGNGTSGSGTTTNANYANAAANTSIAAGVPNIKDNFYFVDTYYGSVALAPNSDNGLIKYNSKTTSDSTNRSDTDGTTTSRQKYVFDASQVNAIYGKSSTVQPPAYVVNVWRRTA